MNNHCTVWQLRIVEGLAEHISDLSVGGLVEWVFGACAVDYLSLRLASLLCQQYDSWYPRDMYDFEQTLSKPWFQQQLVCLLKACLEASHGKNCKVLLTVCQTVLSVSTVGLGSQTYLLYDQAHMKSSQ